MVGLVVNENYCNVFFKRGNENKYKIEKKKRLGNGL